MALTKVTGQVIKNTTDVTVGVLTVTNTLAVGGTVSIGGTLTYEDVTNVDAVGLVTARNGIVVGSGITLSKDGDVFFTGIATGNGSGLTALNASNLGSGTVPTARLGSGTASSSTFLRGDSTFATVTSTTINNNADNRLITGSGTANTLEAESAITFDGTKILDITSTGGGFFRGTDSDGGVGLLEMGNGDIAIQADTGNAINNSKIHFYVDNTERLRIDSSGRLLVGNTTARAVGDVTSQSQIEGTSFATSSLSLMANAGASAGNQPHLTLGKSRGSSDGANDALVSGDGIGLIQFAGADGTDCNSVAAKIHAFVDGTPGSNDMPGRLTFHTTADGAATPTERLRIDSAGNLTVGNDAGYTLWYNTTNDERCRYQFRQTTGNNRGAAFLEERGDANGMDIFISKSRGGNGAGVITSGDTLGWLKWSGADGTRQHNAAGIQVVNSGTVATGRVAGNMVFYTAPDSASSIQERFRITANGDWKASGFSQTYACMYRALSNSATSNMMNSAGVMVFSSATFSMGNSDVYNTTNGRYTAPIRGLYLFNVNVLMDNSANGNTIGIKAYIDGSSTDIFYIYHRMTTDHYKHTSGSHVLALNAGQYHEFYATAAGAHISNETNFSACLIQAY